MDSERILSQVSVLGRPGKVAAVVVLQPKEFDLHSSDHVPDGIFSYRRV